MSLCCNGARPQASRPADASSRRCAGAFCPVLKPTSKVDLLDRWDAPAAIAEGAVPARRIGQPPQELSPQLVSLDDGVENEIGGQSFKVDVLLILATFVLHELLALGR